MQVLADNGPTFQSRFRNLLRKYNVNLVHSAPYNSQANGCAERHIGLLRTKLNKVLRQERMAKNEWPKVLQLAVHILNDTWRPSLCTNPYEMVYGVKPRGTFTRLLFQYIKPGETVGVLSPEEYNKKLYMERLVDMSEQRQRAINNWKRNQDYYNRKRITKIFDIGDKVWYFAAKHQKYVHKPHDIRPVEYKAISHWIGPYFIVDKLPRQQYRLASEDHFLLRDLHGKDIVDGRFLRFYTCDDDRPTDSIYIFDSDNKDDIQELDQVAPSHIGTLPRSEQPRVLQQLQRQQR